MAEFARGRRIAAMRFHDLRHHPITELAESQASDAPIMAIVALASADIDKVLPQLRGMEGRCT